MSIIKDIAAKHENLPWLESRCIYLTRHGSHAYGTNIASSDEDFKGVAIPTEEYFFGCNKVFEQSITSEPYDCVIYDVRKFFSLASECNPSIIEVLWTDPSDHILVTPIGQMLLDNKQIFLSRKAKHTFSGYALSQLKRIKLHKRYLDNPPTAPPTRGDFGLPERTVIPADQLAAANSAIQKKIDSWQLDLSEVPDSIRKHVETQLQTVLLEATTPLWEQAAHNLGYDVNFIELLDKERKYNAKHKEWVNYLEWKTSRNPDRALLEAKFGYDCKHAMHLVRLLSTCRELLTTGKVTVKRPDREQLLAIRNGAWSYDKMIEWAENEDKELDELRHSSPLPRAPDHNAIDALCVRMVKESLNGDVNGME